MFEVAAREGDSKAVVGPGLEGAEAKHRILLGPVGDEPWEVDHRRRRRSVVAAVGGLDGAPFGADCAKANVIGEREALQDVLGERIWEIKPWWNV